VIDGHETCKQSQSDFPHYVYENMGNLHRMASIVRRRFVISRFKL
jgi:hypothetical protein